MWMSRAAISMEEDMKRSKNRCPACAKLQQKVERKRTAALKTNLVLPVSRSSAGLESGSGSGTRADGSSQSAKGNNKRSVEIPTPAQETSTTTDGSGVLSAERNNGNVCRKNNSNNEIAGWESAAPSHRAKIMKAENSYPAAKISPHDKDGHRVDVGVDRDGSAGSKSDMQQQTTPRTQPTASASTSRKQSLVAASSQEEDVVCEHCLCRDNSHGVDDTGQPGCCAKKCGKRNRICYECRKPGSSCVNGVAALGCPIAGTVGACRSSCCTHCKCGCAAEKPHKFEDSPALVIDRARSDQQLCRYCLECWSGWCMPHTGKKRKRAGQNMTREEAFARSWGPGRDADVYILTGLFDEMTGLLPEESFPRDVFGRSLRYLKSFAGRVDVHNVLREAGVATGKGSAGIGEAWSGGGSQHPPERPGGARKVVGAPLRQGPGADQHFSRRYGRRDHNWQWNMDESPWARGLMAKGRLALAVQDDEANEFEEAGIIAFPGSVVKHKDSNKNGGYGKTIGTVVLRSPEQAFVCLQIQGKLLSRAIDAAKQRRVQLPAKFATKGRFKFSINELDAWAMIGGAARDEAEHAVVCGRKTIPRGEPGEGFVRLAFNMRWGWQEDPKV